MHPKKFGFQDEGYQYPKKFGGQIERVNNLNRDDLLRNSNSSFENFIKSG